MKTLKIFGLLCFIAAFAVNNINAQNGVDKTEFMFSLGCQSLPCLDDYLSGDVVVESMLMKNNMIQKIKKATVLGYEDESCTIPSGNVYEISQIATGFYGSSSWESTLHCRLNGKPVFEIHFVFHMTTDANGHIIVKLDKTMVNCKN
jgi:hypothetical protein